MAATLRDYLRAILDSRIDEANFTAEIATLIQKTDSWTAVIRGSGTAGTYEIASQNCRYTRIGRRVWLDVDLTMAGAVTGGGTGFLQITGAPYVKIANTRPIGTVRLSGVDIAAGAHPALSFISLAATAVLYIAETNDNAATTDLQIAGLAATDVISGSICYETDDP